MIYKEIHHNYFISTSFGVLILLAILSIVKVIASSGNQLVLIPLILVVLALGLMLYNFYRLKIIVDEDQLYLQLGKGKLIKQFSISEIEPESVSLTKIPWYYVGGFKLAPGNKTNFAIKPGKAVSFQLKNSVEKILIGSVQPKKLQHALKSHLRQVNLR